MGIKVVKWTEDSAPNKLKMLLSDAMYYRETVVEPQWRINEVTIYGAMGKMAEEQNIGNYSINDLAEYLEQEVDQGVGVNYAFKHYRFLHAQMSANPPSIVARRASSDPSDQRRANAADKLCRHAIRKYKMQEVQDRCTAQTLLYGTGYIKTEQNENDGDIIKFDEDTGVVEMTGEINIYSPSSWDIWLDPFAHNQEQVRYIWERCWYSLEEALSLFPNYEEEIRSVYEKIAGGEIRYADRFRKNLEEKRIAVFKYYEKGMPLNGMAGRYVVCLEDGTLLSPIQKNPFRFFPAPETREELENIIEAEETGRQIDRGLETAYLPFHLLTDIDVVDQVYGKSFIEYEAIIQDVLNRIDSVTLDNARAHSVVRMVLPDGVDIAKGTITDTPFEVIRTTGNQKPHYIGAPSEMPQLTSLRDRLQAGGDDMAGVNESMFGKQQREQSGFLMQFATNQGNMIRRRLFNKYVMCVESTFLGFLSLVRKHWKVARTIKVLGKENSYETIDIKGADILGGFDLVVEYGASFSLDPTTRKDEILQLSPLFEKYGVDGKTILRFLKLNDLESIYDLNDLPALRQQEIIVEMIDNKVYVPPRDKQDHDGMLAYCYKFVMTSEYRDLPEEIKALIDKHIDDREAMKAQQMGVPGLVEAGGGKPPGPMQMPEVTGEMATAGPEMASGAPLPAIEV